MSSCGPQIEEVALASSIGSRGPTALPNTAPASAMCDFVFAPAMTRDRGTGTGAPMRAGVATGATPARLA